MLREADFSEIYIACGHTDLRHGIDGLAAIIQQQFDQSTLFDNRYIR